MSTSIQVSCLYPNADFYSGEQATQTGCACCVLCVLVAVAGLQGPFSASCGILTAKFVSVMHKINHLVGTAYLGLLHIAWMQSDLPLACL